jgi:anti-sigma factor RsiW
MPFRKCQEVLEELDRFVDGDAATLERLRFSMHLAMCPPCERYFRQYRSAREAVGRVDEGQLPADFGEVMGRMLEAMRAARDAGRGAGGAGADEPPDDGPAQA